MDISSIIKHLNKIITHKIYVAYYCFMCRLFWQGIFHDMSKFSFTEFFESVKYYQGDISPIDACKAEKGYSLAWFHHRGRNKHHWEYWVDDFQKGMIPKKMPFKYVLEMVCDYLGAGKAYNGVYFTIEQEYAWWQTRREVVVLHEDTLNLVDELFDMMLCRGIKETLRDRKYIKGAKILYEAKSTLAKGELVHG